MLMRYGLIRGFIVPLSDIPNARAGRDYDEISAYDFCDTCNKQVALYNDRTIDAMFRPAMFSYVYRRWYRPYKNNIENNEYIAKFIRLSGAEADFDWLPPRDTATSSTKPDMPAVHTVPERPEPPQSTIDALIYRHGMLCEEVENRRQVYIKHISNIAAGVVESWEVDHVKDHHNYILQPLFRAVIILASSNFYIGQTSRTVGDMPVFLIHTGVEEGLSAPIRFDSLGDKINPSSRYYSSKDGRTVKVSLEAAMEFVETLQAREEAAYGMRPDPNITVRENPRTGQICVDDENLQGFVDKVMEGPSHEWVDAEKHPDWFAAAATDKEEPRWRWLDVRERAALGQDEERINEPWRKVSQDYTILK